MSSPKKLLRFQVSLKNIGSTIPECTEEESENVDKFEQLQNVKFEHLQNTISTVGIFKTLNSIKETERTFTDIKKSISIRPRRLSKPPSLEKIVEGTVETWDINPGSNITKLIDPATGKYYMASAIPENELERNEALNRLQILDTEPDDSYDAITELAAKICQVPICCISLLDRKRQWFKSHHGLGATETPRAFSFCSHAILEDAVFVIEDTSKDERFMGNPLVTGSPDIKFYAGQPLYSNDGYPLGALCVIDKKPNAITEDQKEILRILAKHVQNKLNSSILIAKLEESVGMLNRIMNQVFPASILEKLKEIEASKANLHQCNLIQVVADDYDEATCVVANIFNFSELSQTLPAATFVNTLTSLWDAFDRASEAFAMTKIKAFNGSFICVGGIPSFIEDHVKIATKFAVMLQNITHDFNKSFAVQVVLRIGIDTGPVGAGIVGNFRPRYDCFGKAMTGAIKTMESCVKGKITITKEVAEKIKEHFILLPESSGSFVVLNEK